MSKFPMPLDEAERLAVLREYDIMDTAPEQTYDDLVRLASVICSTPIALITLLDEERQWFKARVGVEVDGTAREHAFCAHAILGKGLFVVPDASADARFAANPMVAGDPRIRFYAGSPLTTASGHSLGTNCVLDSTPRALTPEQSSALEALGRLVVSQLELRRTARRLAESLQRVRTLSGLLPICAYCKRVRDDGEYWREVEAYIASRSALEFTHGICPSCVATHFPGLPPEE